MTDYIRQPPHYTNGGIECIDYIRSTLSAEQFEGYLRGNVIKYMHRYQDKSGVQDLKKARQYLDWLIEVQNNG